VKLNNTQKSGTDGSRWPLFGVLFLVLLLVGLFSFRNGKIPVRVATIERGTLRSQISTNGRVEPLKNFEAHATGAATVRRVFVHEGQHVKRGQLLLEMEDADARTQAAHAIAQLRAAEAEQGAAKDGGTREEILNIEAELAKARADRDLAQRNLDSVKRLKEQGAASSGEARDAEAQLNRTMAQVSLLEQKRKARYSPPELAKVDAQTSEARASLAAARGLLAKSNIRAPQSGVVYSLPVREGTYVNAGDLLLEEADLSKVLIRAFVDEPDLGRLHQDQKIEITWDALSGRTWLGTVTGVPASVKLHGNRNVGELVSVADNTDMALLPNINVGVSIITVEHHDVLSAPREALRQDNDGKPYVFAVENETLVRRDVTTGVSTLTQIELQGLPEKTAVALASTNNKTLVDHAAVKVVQ
jgi:HlyD family secretion protein